ncbi:hypothetical protein Z947_3122 [Sulfitobacter geojensis]|nr:hypothetical protein Z947_3122 [Sulfitobacter geojensis]
MSRFRALGPAWVSGWLVVGWRLTARFAQIGEILRENMYFMAVFCVEIAVFA